MKFTKEQVDGFLIFKEELQEKIREISKLVVEYDERIKPETKSWVIDDWEIWNNKVTVYISESWGWGGHNSFSISFPEDFIYNETFLDIILAEKQERDAVNLKKQIENDQLQQKEKAKKELEDYQRLLNSIESKALEWWDEIIDQDRCQEMEKKYGHYGHDMGITKSDIIEMYTDELKEKIGK